MNGRRTNTGNYLVRSEMNVHIRSELADFALGQIREYMFQTKNEHVFITAYNETILVKQESRANVLNEDCASLLLGGLREAHDQDNKSQISVFDDGQQIPLGGLHKSAT